MQTFKAGAKQECAIKWDFCVFFPEFFVAVNEPVMHTPWAMMHLETEIVMHLETETSHLLHGFMTHFLFCFIYQETTQSLQ